jgi:hypothetical protein
LPGALASKKKFRDLAAILRPNHADLIVKLCRFQRRKRDEGVAAILENLLEIFRRGAGDLALWIPFPMRRLKHHEIAIAQETRPPPMRCQ